MVIMIVCGGGGGGGGGFEDEDEDDGDDDGGLVVVVALSVAVLRLFSTLVRKTRWNTSLDSLLMVRFIC